MYRPNLGQDIRVSPPGTFEGAVGVPSSEPSPPLSFSLLHITFPLTTSPPTPPTLYQTCLDAEREARDSERVEPSVTARSCVTTSRESPSRLSAVSHVVEESSVSPDSSTRRPVVFSRSSSRTLSVTPSPTPSTPSARPSPPSTWSTPSSAPERPFMASVSKQYASTHPPFVLHP